MRMCLLYLGLIHLLPGVRCAHQDMSETSFPGWGVVILVYGAS